MKKHLLKLYFWITSKFTKKMTTEEIHQKLLSYTNGFYSQLAEYIANEEKRKAFYKLPTPYSNESLELIFKLGLRKFFIGASIQYQTGFSVIKLYEIIPNQDDFPKEKLHHVEDFDVRIDLEGKIMFKSEMTIDKSIMNGKSVKENVPSTQINNAENYFKQLYKYLKFPYEPQSIMD